MYREKERVYGEIFGFTQYREGEKERGREKGGEKLRKRSKNKKKKERRV